MVHKNKGVQQAHRAILTPNSVPFSPWADVFQVLQPKQAPELAVVADIKQAPEGHRPPGSSVRTGVENAEEQTQIQTPKAGWSAARALVVMGLRSVRLTPACCVVCLRID